MTTELTPDFVVSTRGASLVTVTVAETPAGSSTSRTVESDPTETFTEKEFQLNFLSMMGDIKLLFHSISLCSIFMVILLAAITMSMSARERVTEIAVLKAIGFSRRLVLTLMLIEFTTLTFIGGIAGKGFTQERDIVAELLEQVAQVVGHGRGRVWRRDRPEACTAGAPIAACGNSPCWPRQTQSTRGHAISGQIVIMLRSASAIMKAPIVLILRIDVKLADFGKRYVHATCLSG